MCSLCCGDVTRSPAIICLAPVYNMYVYILIYVYIRICVKMYPYVIYIHTGLICVCIYIYMYISENFVIICIHISSPSQSRPKQQFHWYFQERGAYFQQYFSFFWKPWVFPELFLNKLFNGKTQRTFSFLGSFLNENPKHNAFSLCSLRKTKSLSCLVCGLQQPNKNKHPLSKAKIH